MTVGRWRVKEGIFKDRECLNVTGKESTERKSIKIAISPLSEIRQKAHYLLTPDAEGHTSLVEDSADKGDRPHDPHSVHSLLDTKYNLMKAIKG